MVSLALRMIALALLGWVAACTPWQDVQWREVDAAALPFEDAWNAVLEAAEIDGLLLDPAATDRGERLLVTRWRSRAMPFRGSVRRRLRAEFEQDEDPPGWRVRFHVERQTVSNMAAGFNPTEEDWEPDGQDADIENRLAAKLQLRFHGKMAPMTPAGEATEPPRHVGPGGGPADRWSSR